MSAEREGVGGIMWVSGKGQNMVQVRTCKHRSCQGKLGIGKLGKDRSGKVRSRQDLTQNMLDPTQKYPPLNNNKNRYNNNHLWILKMG